MRGGDIYIQKVGRVGELALQTDAASYDFSMEAHAAVAPSWRNEVTMSSLEALLEYAPARSIELIAPRPLLLIGVAADHTAPIETIRAAYHGAGQPNQLVELDRGHYSVCLRPTALKARKLATDWLATYL